MLWLFISEMLYWAPEVLKDNSAVGQKADAYSYGIIIAEVVDRVKPYEAEKSQGVEIDGNFAKSIFSVSKHSLCLQTF